MVHDRDEAFIDERLARISKETASLRPRPDFRRRVQRALDAEREADSRRIFVRAGRLVLAAAMVLAIGTLAFAAERNRAANEATAISYGVEELEW